MNKKHKPTVKISKLTDGSLVQILHMDDYFPEEGATPYAGKPHKLKEFKKDNVWEDEDFSLEDWYAASGDGDENKALLTIVDGEIRVVIP
jgi:hypothetical protein